jgi:ATP-binding cassette subfamily C protein
LNQKLSIQFSSEFLQHLFKMPMNFYSQRFSGEIAYRMTLNDSVVETLTGPVTSAFLNLLLVVFFAIVMISYEPLIASIGIFLGICNLFVMRWVFQVRANAYAAMQQSRGKSVEESISGLQNIETLKSKGLESDFFLKWVGYYTRQLNAIQSIGRKDVFASAVPVLFQSITIAFLLSIGSFKIVSGALSISKLMVLQSLMMYFLQPINQFVQFGALIQNMKIDLDRLKDVLDNKVDPYLLKSSEKTVSKLKGCLEFRNVSFKYAPLSSPVLENVSFILKPGQRIAFVGPSGSGKSTVTRLASGLYQPTEGEILYDGIPIHELSKESFTNSISVVNQEIFLFSGSIRDNLTFWNPSVPDDVLIKSAKDALIHDEISKRPKGYDSILLEEGRNLSGGERQRLEIARALIYNPSLIILDEATSALDSKLETIFSEKLRQRGCSALMVAHRLSTIRDCDEIIVLNKGVIAERGTHEELKSIGGIYSELINNA